MDKSKLLQQRESFKWFCLKNLEKNATRNELLFGYKIFNDDQFEQVWNVTEGHAGSIAMIADEANIFPIEIAIANVQDFTNYLVSSCLAQAPIDTLTFLRKLQKHNWKMKLDQREIHNEPYKYLLTNKIIFAFPLINYELVPQHKMIQTSIESYLERF